MMGNRALLTNFMEKFLGTVRFIKIDFAVIAGYGDVVIGSVTIKKVYYIMKSPTTNVETSNEEISSHEEVFPESSKSFQEESSSSSLNDDVQQSLEEVMVPPTNTQSMSNNMVPNVNEANIKDVGKLNAKGDIEVFVSYSKESAAFRIYKKRTLSQVDEASKRDLEDLFQDFYDEYFDSSKIMKSSTTNVETPINEEVFHESIPINMVPNGDEASTSYNVFNKRLEDAYFDASTSFHDPSNVHTYYQPYPHEKKWTKKHPLHKIIGDPKSSFRTRGQLANSCLFSCLLSSIEPANVAEALKDVDWVSAMQEELDQFARLKVWRLVPRPEGKSVIKTKWIFNDKKDESSLVIRNKARLVAVGYSQQEG
nr:hypothetical protein [Tanacetum cinerariifolium]